CIKSVVAGHLPGIIALGDMVAAEIEGFGGGQDVGRILAAKRPFEGDARIPPGVEQRLGAVEREIDLPPRRREWNFGGS
ncbi:hypothetical protein OW717_03250, partial [Acidithiobacillus ferriphilus]